MPPAGGGFKVLRVAQSCLTLYDPLDYSLPLSSVHGILQARILEWIAISFSRGSSQPRNQTWVSCTAGSFFTIWVTGEAGFKVEVSIPSRRPGASEFSELMVKTLSCWTYLRPPEILWEFIPLTSPQGLGCVASLVRCFQGPPEWGWALNTHQHNPQKPKHPVQRCSSEQHVLAWLLTLVPTCPAW